MKPRVLGFLLLLGSADFHLQCVTEAENVEKKIVVKRSEACCGRFLNDCGCCSRRRNDRVAGHGERSVVIHMKKVFWENPYQCSLQTTVTSVHGNELVFAETIAYSFAGGQESDTATVNGIQVLNSRREGNFIYYTLPDGHNLRPGDAVDMRIDWLRRHKLMRLHFAAELILEIVSRKFGYEKVGAHIAETKARIDFVSDTHIGAHFDEILAEYNDIIKHDYPIVTGYSDVENQRRFWKIEAFAQVPCGGTHVRSTAEVGYVTLKRERPGKGIERIEIRLVQSS